MIAPVVCPFCRRSHCLECQLFWTSGMVCPCGRLHVQPSSGRKWVLLQLSSDALWGSRWTEALVIDAVRTGTELPVLVPSITRTAVLRGLLWVGDPVLEQDLPRVLDSFVRRALVDEVMSS